jgi:hypothetical protein
MFGSLSRPGEPLPENHQFNFSNSHSATNSSVVMPGLVPGIHVFASVK